MKLGVEVLPAKDVNVGKPQITVPTSIVLEREVGIVGGAPNAAVHYSGITYVGKNCGGIDSIDMQGNLTPFVASGNGRVGSIQVYGDGLLALRAGVPYQLCLYSLDGKLMRSHKQQGGTITHGRWMVVVEGLALVVCRALKQINIHSTNDFTLLRSVKCDSVPSGGYFSIAAIAKDSLILASDRGIISILNYHTGQVTWTSSHKFCETAVQPLNDEIVFLSGSNYYDNKMDVSVKLRNIKTGQ